MFDKKGDKNTINNSGSIGAIAIGKGSTAINAGDNASIDTATNLEEHYKALQNLISQHEKNAELTVLLQEAIRLSKSDNPAASKSIWDNIAKYGGAIGSVVSGIVGLLAL